MTESKKAWVEPELIVLVRNKSEEAVLGVCKSWGEINEVTSFNGCDNLGCVGGCTDPGPS
jgi:hypothetical protein